MEENNDFTVYIACLVCGEHFEDKINGIPDGWRNHYMHFSDEDSFCPEHSDMTKFLSDQCSGCVGTFPDCPLHRAIFVRYPDITSEEIITIERGVCPRRVNGTFMVVVGNKDRSIEEINISDVSEDGMTFANGVREYLKRWASEYYHENIEEE